MHTSWLTFGLFVGGVSIAIAAQIVNYWIWISPKTTARTLVFTVSMIAIVLSAAAAWRAAIDWGHLPPDSDDLPNGALYNNGGEPAIHGNGVSK